MILESAKLHGSSAKRPTWNQSKNPITVGFSESRVPAERNYATRMVDVPRASRYVVNSKHRRISKRKCNFHGAAWTGDSLHSTPMAKLDLVHDSMRNISMFSRSNDPSELI
ncbi:hypothetical protein K0M31_004389, partial [Melipona bicolor]